MSHVLRRPAALFAAFLVLAAARADAAGPESATAARRVVEGFHETVIEVMKNAGKLGIRGRYQRFAPEIRRVFDSRLMIAIAAGRYWRQADAASQTRLVDAFRRLSTATYAARFDGYSGERFELLGVDDGPRKTQIVRTRIVDAGEKKPVSLSYVLRGGAAGWRVADVLVDAGISELAVRRSEYAAVLQRDGVDGLVRLLTEKADRLLTP